MLKNQGQKLKASILILFVLTTTEALSNTGYENVKVSRIRILPERFAYLKSHMATKEGHPFHSDIINADLRMALKISDEIERSFIEVELKEGHVYLTCHFIPYRIIKEIEISGNRALRKTEIMSRLKMEAGMRFSPSLLEKSEGSIKGIYRKSGYHRIVVKQDIITDRDTGEVTIQIHIEEGKPIRIGHIKLEIKELNHSSDIFRIGELFLKTSLNLKEGDVLNVNRLNSNIISLKKQFLKRRYLNVQINEPEIRTDSETGRADVKIVVDPGPKAFFKFEGDRHYWKFELLPVLKIEEKEKLDQGVITEWIEDLTLFYQDRGYYTVEVKCRQKVDHREGRKEVIFTINKGPKVGVEEIRFHGNVNISSRKLKKAIQTKEGSLIPYHEGIFNPKRFEGDLSSISALYRSEGFLDTIIMEHKARLMEKSHKLVVDIFIKEGERTRVKDIQFVGIPEDISKKIYLRMKLKKGKPFDPVLLEEDSRRILRYFTSDGYLDAKVDSGWKRVEKNPKWVIITHNVNIGEIFHANDFHIRRIRGRRYTKDSVILREITQKRFEPIDQDKLLKSKSKLYRKGYFREIKIYAGNEVKRIQGNRLARDIYIDVEDRKAGGVEFGGGYGSYKGFQGYSEIAHRNLFGTGRTLAFRSELTQKDQLYRLGYREPYLWFTQLGARLNLALEREELGDYNTETLSATIGLDRTVLLEEITASLQYKFERIAYLDYPLGYESRLPGGSGRPRYIGSISPGLVYDLRDNFFDPREGSIHSLKMDYANPFILSKIHFLKFVGRTTWYFSPLWPATFVLSGRSGYILTRAPLRDIDADDRFRLGGRNSVRGFEERQIRAQDDDPGDLYIQLNSEVRFPMGENWGGMVFLDGGNVWNTSMPTSIHLRSSIGGGIRYKTPVGTLAFLIGFKLDRKADEDIEAWHITIGEVL